MEEDIWDARNMMILLYVVVQITGALKDVMQLTKQQLDESRFQTNELSTRLGMARDSNENL